MGGATRARAGPPRDRGPRGPRPAFRAPGNLTPLLRLVGLIALAILVVVPARRLGRGLRDRPQARALHRLHDRDRRRRQCVRAARAGARDHADHSGPQARGPRREARWLRPDRGEPGAACGGSRRAGPLHDAHEGALEALRFRVNGLRGLQTAFQKTADATDAAAAGSELAAQGQRLLASDIVWADSFRARAQAVLESEEVEGLEVPTSEFVADDEIMSPSDLAAIWQRIQGASTGGTPSGLHGSGISYVKALPSGQLLSDDDRGHDPGDGRARVRGRRRGHRRQPGGAAQGHADDPEPTRPDRADEDDPDHRSRARPRR